MVLAEKYIWWLGIKNANRRKKARKGDFPNGSPLKTDLLLISWSRVLSQGKENERYVEAVLHVRVEMGKKSDFGWAIGRQKLETNPQHAEFGWMPPSKFALPQKCGNCDHVEVVGG